MQARICAWAQSPPSIFIVHSMGGLVAKKGYLGSQDEAYSNIIHSISAIIFLATPHRGSNLAETLNRVLSESFQSPKSFISDLNKSSPAIEDLNEQFYHHASKISLWSFYKTLATSIGPKKLMVVDKRSSVLGYPAEISRPLQADHHDVCKYSSPVGSNHVSVRNAIRTLVSMFCPQVSRKAEDAAGTTCNKDSAVLGSFISYSERVWYQIIVHGFCGSQESCLEWNRPQSLDPSPRFSDIMHHPAMGNQLLRLF